jgi:hypothetical protein
MLSGNYTFFCEKINRSVTDLFSSYIGTSFYRGSLTEASMSALSDSSETSHSSSRLKTSDILLLSTFLQPVTYRISIVNVVEGLWDEM